MKVAGQSRIWSQYDVWANGRISDFLRIPHSSNRSAYGWLPVPFVSIKNGEGPCALLVAGNHGDEYEGQIVLRHLAHSLSVDDIRGHLLILPALNYPAVAAAQRVSPIDEGNLNRSFPGKADGTPTQMLAHFLTSQIIPQVDFVIDFHSGGRSLEFMPCALAKYDDGSRQIEQDNLKLLRDFGAPISYLTSGEGGGADTTLAAAAQSLGIPAIMTELGGGEGLNEDGMAIARQGLLRVLAARRIIAPRTGDHCPETRFMRVRSRDDYVYSGGNGLFEPLVSLGQDVERGQPAARVHTIEAVDQEPDIVRFASSGMVACRRAQSRVNIGDCLFHLIAETRIRKQPPAQ